MRHDDQTAFADQCREWPDQPVIQQRKMMPRAHGQLWQVRSHACRAMAQCSGLEAEVRDSNLDLFLACKIANHRSGCSI